MRPGAAGIGEENGAQRDNARARRDELERVEPRATLPPFRRSERRPRVRTAETQARAIGLSAGPE